MWKKFLVILGVLTTLSFTGLPTIAAYAVWTILLPLLAQFH